MVNGQQNYNMPPVVMNLLILNALVWFATNMLVVGGVGHSGHSGLFDALAVYSPTSPYFRIWQPLTHLFVQSGGWHLFLNMFTLWMFGRQAEYDMGSRRFLIYYLVCGLGAAAMQMAVGALMGDNPNVPMVGASGAVYGILLAFGVMHANARVMLLILPIPMKAKWLVIIFGALELFGGLSSGVGLFAKDDVAHFAHLGGMLWGFLLLLYWKKTGKIYY
jgi:membrane associated rhomboid family serine protease